MAKVAWEEYRIYITLGRAASVQIMFLSLIWYKLLVWLSYKVLPKPNRFSVINSCHANSVPYYRTFKRPSPPHIMFSVRIPMESWRDPGRVWDARLIMRLR